MADAGLLSSVLRVHVTYHTFRDANDPSVTADWTKLMVDASLLCADAGIVMALRSWRLMAGGPAAQRELQRMFGEKTEAGFELAGALAGGRVKSPEGAARTALGIYGKRVRGNRRRLG